MKYDYKCSQCDRVVEVTKYASQLDRVERCDYCQRPMEKLFTPSKLFLNNTKVPEKYYNVGLGQVVDSDRHAQRIAKEKGLIEVGNENPRDHIDTRTPSLDDLKF